MLHILLQRVNLKNLFLIFFVVFSVAGCSVLSGSGNTMLQNDAYASSDFYLDKVNSSQNDNERTNYQLLAVRALLSENKINQAESLLSSLKDLDKSQQLDASLLKAHLLSVQRDNHGAITLLNTIDLNVLSSSQKVRYYGVLAQVSENSKDFVGAINAHIQMDRFITDMQRKQQNNDTIWSLLRSLDKNTLNSLIVEPNDIVLKGWIDLAKVYNDHLSQPEQMRFAIQNWKMTYANHSAAFLLPTDLRGVVNFEELTLKQVALLLPLSGNAQLIGKIIQQGFNDAHGSSSVIVKNYDTMSGISVVDLVNQAKQEGAQAVVGPLLKDNVETLLNSSVMQGLSVLTLNTAPSMRPLQGVCYYGLSPEDEAQSAAVKMWNDGETNPMVFAPQNDLGQRSASAFNAKWQRLAGTDANTYYYSLVDDILANIKNAAMSGKVNAIYVVADSQQLQEIKTALDNSDAHSIAIYATSRSNSANNGPDYRITMNGVKFSDIPFLSDLNSASYQQALKLANGDYSLLRLYAMGADAWILISKFAEMRQIPGYSINGLTGVLQAGDGCNIERSMTWLQYDNGNIKTIN
ncbi:penicillin-binding protein activator [Gallibacterium trehalosifermentans]|uniref:Penicillin-binding protein activator LpoA n=1 Tax=Gallibacterium trehalosifermentans TaxID=516935 RepID=A0ABV6GYV6_9PAST